MTAARAAAIVERVGAYAVVVLAVALTVAPLLWIGIISLKPEREAFALPPDLIFAPDFSNYARVWAKPSFRDAFFNSAVVTAMGVSMALAFGTLAAYALARMRFTGKRALLLWLLLAYLLPEFLYILPIYVLYQTVGLYDTPFGLALIYQVFALPFAIWMLQTTFQEVPRELDDAARIDGCGPIKTLLYVYIPVTAPGIAATAVLTAIWMWNELAIALALTFRHAQTLTVAVTSFRGYASIEWGPLTAASVSAIVPMLILSALAQRYIVKGLTLGAVK